MSIRSITTADFPPLPAPEYPLYGNQTAINHWFIECLRLAQNDTVNHSVVFPYETIEALQKAIAPKATIKRAIRLFSWVAKAAAKQDARYCLKSVWSDGHTMVATDGNRLHFALSDKDRAIPGLYCPKSGKLLALASGRLCTGTELDNAVNYETGVLPLRDAPDAPKKMICLNEQPEHLSCRIGGTVKSSGIDLKGVQYPEISHAIESYFGFSADNHTTATPEWIQAAPVQGAGKIKAIFLPCTDPAAQEPPSMHEYLIRGLDPLSDIPEWLKVDSEGNNRAWAPSQDKPAYIVAGFNADYIAGACAQLKINGGTITPLIKTGSVRSPAVLRFDDRNGVMVAGAIVMPMSI